MTNAENNCNSAQSNKQKPHASSPAFEQRIIVMARCPESGKAKTRLIPALGPGGAAALHECLVRHTLKTVKQFVDHQTCDVDVQFAGGTTADMRRLFGDDMKYNPQQGDQLGERMSSAVGGAFRDGCRRVVVIGTDCPQLEMAHLEQAFLNLHHKDVTLGPAIDGGYYLIGMQEHYEFLFENIRWGSETVFRETLENLRTIRKSSAMLPSLSDVDYPEDLVFCRQTPEAFSPPLPQAETGLLSVIVPALNEEAVLPHLLNQLQQEKNIEVIVADGGSTDATCQIAKESGVKLIRCNIGRGKQMNAGASLTRGEALLFLHADAQLPENFRQTVWDSLQSGHIGGAFRLRIGDPRWRYRIVEFGANLRSRWFQLPYGDQGIFVRSDEFFAMNGFQNWPLLEDYDFAQRLRRRGRILITSSSATVSARRWQRVGVLKATLLNQVIVAGFRIGVSPIRLAALYARSK